MQYQRTILITGSNKGIGYILAQQVAKLNKYCIIMTSRNQLLGYQSYNTLQQKYPQSNIKYHQLDITDNQSIDHILKYLSNNNIMVDILVNNAALGYDQPYSVPSYQLANAYFNCNYFGTVNFTYKILQLLTKDAKIINISSRTGALQNHSLDIQHQLSNNDISLQNIQQHINIYLKGCRQNDLKGYYQSAYSSSKTFLNVWSHYILKKQLKQQQSVVLMSPGFCMTDMIKNSIQDPRTNAPPPKDPLIGVNTIIYIIEQLPFSNQNSGKFYYDKKEWNIQKMK